jgi:steroid 5-alpha reductase family enzyme
MEKMNKKLAFVFGFLFLLIPFISANPLGETLTTGIAISYIGLIGLFVFLFLVTMGAIAFLDNNRFKPDSNGKIMDRGAVAYVKPVLYLVAWAILLGTFFIASNFAIGYMNFDLLGKALFLVYKGMMSLSLPLIVFWLIWIFVSIFQDRETKRILERGGDDFGSI